MEPTVIAPLTVSKFALERNFANKGYSWTDLHPNQIIKLVTKNWDKRIPGTGETSLDRKVLVPISLADDNGLPISQYFHSPFVRIQDGQRLTSKVVCRQPGEDPYIETVLLVDRGEYQLVGKILQQGKVERLPIVHVNVVCYSREALMENASPKSEPSQYDWEIVAIIASWMENEPMEPLTMARNMLEKVGGTKSTYTAEQFAESIYYWSQLVKTKEGSDGKIRFDPTPYLTEK